MVKQIKIEDAFKLKNTLFLDTRTPKEYQEDHIKNAINVPILSNEERHEIGIIYKQISREKAIDRGMELFPSKIPSIMNIVKGHKDKNIIVYCARGGMRSKIIASLLESIDYNVYQVEGGYKLFRQYMLEQIKNMQVKPELGVLYGLTCSGKTKLLNKFPNSIDLEGMAQHRSSLYGAVGLTPNSQKKFENLLLQKLEELQDEKFIFVEGESRRIGNVIIPEFFWKAMKQGTAVLVKRDLNLRVKEMIDEYFTSEENINQIKKITPTLKRVISKKNKQLVTEALDKGNYQTVGEILLTKYYDPLYSHTINKQNFSFEVCSDDIGEAVRELKNKTLLKSNDAHKTTLK